MAGYCLYIPKYFIGVKVMSGESNKVEVTILDKQYVIRGNESTEYIEMLASQLDNRLEQVKGMNPSLSIVQISILTALNLLDELTKLKREHQDFINLLDDSN